MRSGPGQGIQTDPARAGVSSARRRTRGARRLGDFEGDPCQGSILESPVSPEHALLTSLLRFGAERAAARHARSTWGATSAPFAAPAGHSSRSFRAFLAAPGTYARWRIGVADCEVGSQGFECPRRRCDHEPCSWSCSQHGFFWIWARKVYDDHLTRHRRQPVTWRALGEVRSPLRRVCRTYAPGEVVTARRGKK